MSSDPSSMLERMVEALGGWAVVEADPRRAPSIRPGPGAPPLSPGVVLADRYELLAELGAAPEGMFRARDRTTRQAVLLRVLRDLPIDASLIDRFHLAVAVSHPNVCRVHDLVPTDAGPAVIMEGLSGETLATRLEEVRARGGMSVEAFRRIASDLFAGLAAIHAHDAFHGEVDPRHVLIGDRKAVILDFAFGKRHPGLRARPAAERQERPAADVLAAAQVCWAMFCREPPDLGRSPRESPLRAHATSELPIRLASDELRQIFRAMSPEVALRPTARNMRFVQSTARTPTFARQEHRIFPGPPPGPLRGHLAGRQALLVTFAATAPESVGHLLPLDLPSLTLGRSDRADLQVPERTVSSLHARITWDRGQWRVEDLGSTNGTFADGEYARQKSVVLRHGGEVQLGEMRVMLVSFAPSSPDHLRAQRFCARRDPLTGLLGPASLEIELAEDLAFATWAELPMCIATFELVRGGPPTDRMAILEQLALRRVAMRAVELTDNMLLSLTPVVAGRPLDVDRGGKAPRTSFLVATVGPTEPQARNVVDLVLSEARAHLPPGFSLRGELSVRRR